MSDISAPYIGRSLLRREDRRLLTGQGQFVADIVLPRMAHAVIVRSSVAHARIRSVDLSRALAAPGVLEALNGADLLQLLPPVPEGQISLPRKWQNVVQHKFLSPSGPLLRMTRSGMSARPSRSSSRKPATRRKMRPSWSRQTSRNCQR